jgi:hypothetical protein
MGMLTFTVAAYTLPNGQLAVTRWVPQVSTDGHLFSCAGRYFCSHDHMAPMMGVNVPPFREKFRDTVDQVKRNMLKYVKNLLIAAGEREIAESDDNDLMPPIMKVTASGLSILPDPNAWKGQVKKMLEPFLRMYLGQHYSKCHFDFENRWPIIQQRSHQAVSEGMSPFWHWKETLGI